MELNEWIERYEAAGVQVVAVTYDDVSILAEFSAAQTLRYALLTDPQGVYVNRLGIRNEQYDAGDRGFGIPHPGIMLFDADLTVRYKAAIPDYRERPAPQDVYDAVLDALGS